MSIPAGIVDRKDRQMAEQKGKVIDESGAEVASIRESQVARMARLMDLEASIVGGASARDIVTRIQENILAAENDEDIFALADVSLPGGEDFVDIPTLIKDFTFVKSSFSKEDGALPAFAVVLALNLDSGEEVTYSIGAQSAVAQLFRFNEKQAFTERKTEMSDGSFTEGFPMAVKGKPTSSGYTALMYRPLTPNEAKRSGIKVTEKK